MDIAKNIYAMDIDWKDVRYRIDIKSWQIYVKLDFVVSL